jgi:hypothetical protein
MLRIGSTFQYCGRTCTVTGFAPGKVHYRTPEGFTGSVDAALIASGKLEG